MITRRSKMKPVRLSIAAILDEVAAQVLAPKGRLVGTEEKQANEALAADIRGYVDVARESKAVLVVKRLPARDVDRWSREHRACVVQIEKLKTAPNPENPLGKVLPVEAQEESNAIMEGFRKMVFTETFGSLEGFEMAEPTSAEEAWEALYDFLGAMTANVVTKIQEVQRPGAVDFLSFESSGPCEETSPSLD